MSVEQKEQDKFIDINGNTCVRITLVSGNNELGRNARGDREWDKFMPDGSIRAVSVV